MSSVRGGKISLSLSNRFVVALLLCANAFVAAVAFREVAPKVSAFFTPPEQSQAVAVTYGTCGQTAAKTEPVRLAAKYSGFLQVIDQPFYYAVAGTTLDEIRSQIHTCNAALPSAIQGKYVADTTYIINWRARYASVGLKKCKITNLAVGLRTRQILPNWTNTNASAEVATSWNSFRQYLGVHEEGHVRLSQQYATKIFQTLQALPVSDCQTIRQHADALANNLVLDLGQANLEYDNATDHGRTQGATL